MARVVLPYQDQPEPAQQVSARLESQSVAATHLTTSRSLIFLRSWCEVELTYADIGQLRQPMCWGASIGHQLPHTVPTPSCCIGCRGILILL